jgi:hypothetical protein
MERSETPESLGFGVERQKCVQNRRTKIYMHLS